MKEKKIKESRVSAIEITKHKVVFKFQGSQYEYEKRNLKKLKATLRWKLGMTKEEVDEILDFIGKGYDY